MNIQIKTYNETDRAEWSAFVSAHPHGSVFQSPEMYEGYLHTVGHTPLLWAAYSDGHLVGVLLAVILQESGIKARFSKRSIIIGGPLVQDDKEEIISTLLQAYNQDIAGQVIYTQIRNHWEQLQHCDLFREAGYVFESHLNYLVPLGTDDDMWGRIGKGRIKQIKKAQKNELSVQAFSAGELTDERLEEGYYVIERVYQRAGLPLVNVQLMKEMNKAGKLVLWEVRGKREEGREELMGCRFALVYGKTVYGWYAGSYDQYYKYYPNDLLIWETLRWCAAQGYETFDMMGAGQPNKPYGVRAFKQQVGGTLTNYGRFEKIHKPWMYWLGVVGMEVLKLLKKGQKK